LRAFVGIVVLVSSLRWLPLLLVWSCAGGVSRAPGGATAAAVAEDRSSTRTGADAEGGEAPDTSPTPSSPPAQDHTSSNGSHRKLETSTTIPTKARKATSGIGSDSSTGSGRDRELLPPVILIVHHHRGHPTSNPHLQARKLLQHYVKMTSVHFVG
jgi:hypothetical protein